MIFTVAQINLRFSSFGKSKTLSILETNINVELNNIHIWLCTNKLSLNIEKSKFVIFHPPQKKLQSHNLNLAINNKQLKREFWASELIQT